MMPLARRFAAWDVSPDVITWASLLVGVAAGACFYAAAPEAPGFLLAAALMTYANGILDGIDGRLARLTGRATPRGDFLDHAVDRFADAAILVGLGLSPLVDPRVGVVAVAGVLLTSYMGTQAQAVGMKRAYGGLLGRADRVALLVSVSILEVARFMLDVELPFGRSLLELLLGLFAVVGVFTAVQRFVLIWRELSSTRGP